MDNFKIIDNISETMGETLPPMIRKSTKTLYCGIGYFLDSGYQNIQDEIINIANNGADVRIIAGNLFVQVDGIPTINPNLDKETYELIINLSDYSNNKVKLRSIKEQFFHGKFFLGIGDGEAYFIGGSSNMSFRANSSKGNIEYNLYTTQETNSELILRNKDWFENLWNNKAVSLSPDNLEEIRFLLNKLIFGIDVQEDIREKGTSKEKSEIEIQCEIIDKMLINVGLNTIKPIMSESDKTQAADPFVKTILYLYNHKDEMKTNRLSEILNSLCYTERKSLTKLEEELTNILNTGTIHEYYYDVVKMILKKNISKGVPNYSTFLENMVSLFDIYYNDYHNKAYKKGSHSGSSKNKPRLNTDMVNPTGLNFYSPIDVSDNRAEYLLEAIRNIRGSFSDNWLFQYQTYDVNILVQKYDFLEKGAYIAHEAGMGKSPIMCKFIKDIQEKNQETRILIAVPAALMTQWQEDNLLHDFGIQSEIVDSYKVNKEGESIWTNRKINICSIDYLKNTIANENNEFIKKMSPDILIVDEAHLLKNVDSGRYSEISKLSPKFVLLASATPLQNEIKEFLAQLKLIDNSVDETRFKDIEYVKKLRDKYVIRRTRKHDLAEVKNIKQAKREVQPLEIELTTSFKSIYDELENKLKDGELYYYKFLGEINDSDRYQNIDAMVSFMTLQELTSSTMACVQGLSKIKRKIEFIINSDYENLSEESISEYDTKEERDVISMLCENKYEITPDKINKSKNDINFIDSYINPITGRLYNNGQVINNPKEQHFINLINTKIKDKQAIVFVKYIDTGKSLCETLNNKGYKADFYEGSLSRNQRKELVNKFKQNEIQFLICTDSANAGLNLQTTDTLINYDLNWNPQIVEQRIGRIHRIGQKALKVSIYNLILKDTVDGRIQELMKKKEDTFNSLFETSDIILGKLAKEYMNGDISKLENIEEIFVSKEDVEEDLLSENKDETTKLNNDYHYMESALRMLLMWIMKKYNMTYYTDDNETYIVKLSTGDTQLVHLNQVYNMIEDENDFFKDFEISPIQNRKIKKCERNIERFYFGSEKQTSREIGIELDKINATTELKEEISKMIISGKTKNLLLLNLDVEYQIELNGDIFTRNEFKTVVITPDYEIFSNIDVARLFYVVPSIPADTKRIDTIVNGNIYITMYNDILKNRLIFDKQNNTTNEDILVKDVTFQIYNGTIIEID